MSLIQRSCLNFFGQGSHGLWLCTLKPRREKIAPYFQLPWTRQSRRRTRHATAAVAPGSAGAEVGSPEADRPLLLNMLKLNLLLQVLTTGFVLCVGSKSCFPSFVAVLEARCHSFIISNGLSSHPKKVWTPASVTKTEWPHDILGTMATPSSHFRTAVELRISCEGLTNKDVFSKSDPTCIVKEMRKGAAGRGDFRKVGRSIYIYKL